MFDVYERYDSAGDSIFLFEFTLEKLMGIDRRQSKTVKLKLVDVFEVLLKVPKQPNFFKSEITPLTKKSPSKSKKQLAKNKNVYKKAKQERSIATNSAIYSGTAEVLMSILMDHNLQISVWKGNSDTTCLGAVKIQWDDEYFNFLQDIIDNNQPPPLPVVIKQAHSMQDLNDFDGKIGVTLKVKLTYFNPKVLAHKEPIMRDRFEKIKKPKTSEESYLDKEKNICQRLLKTIKTYNKIKEDQSKDMIRDRDIIDTHSTDDVQLRKALSGFMEFLTKKSNSGSLTGPCGCGIDNCKFVQHINDSFDNREIENLHDTETEENNILKRDNQLVVQNRYDETAYNKEAKPNQKVYTVSYFTVEYNKDSETGSKPGSDDEKSKSNSKNTSKTNSVKSINAKNSKSVSLKESNSSAKNSSDKEVTDFCKPDCGGTGTIYKCGENQCFLPSDFEIIPCGENENCEVSCKKSGHIQIRNDSSLEIKLEDINNLCGIKSCDVGDQVKEYLVDGVTNAPPEKTFVDPCYCDCSCKFEFGKKTKYCAICGGYEDPGDDMNNLPAYAFPTPPCPIYHNLFDKSKFKTMSTFPTTASETKKKELETSNSKHASSASKTFSGPKDQHGSKKSLHSMQNKPEIEKDGKKKEKKSIGKFTCHFDYKAPQAGHIRCYTPQQFVPKNMGWLWNSPNVPGMKFRPDWRPGATNKRVVSMLSRVQTSGGVFSKRKRREKAKPRKKFEKKPLLVVTKKDGQYEISMETMKIIDGVREVNVYPFEDAPPQKFIVGRTDEENAKRLKRFEREKRRRQRAERHYLQQTFRNMCNDVCLKTYQQAVGILDVQGDCVCYPQNPDMVNTNLDYSCSCSDESGDSSEETCTDDDEWVVEFTPPVARFEPSLKLTRVPKAENSSQYSYLDYRVKLLDRLGNPIPRFFIGPDGKKVCSDLGVFFGPNKKWLEIGVDGWIGPDERWVPMRFIGPDGHPVETETGKFQWTDGRWLVIGIDGYVDGQGKWRFYNESSAKVIPKAKTYTESSWSCLGTATPKLIAERGIVGHGVDRKLLIERLQKAIDEGDADIKIPRPSKVPKSPYRPSPDKLKEQRKRMLSMFTYKCKHPTPSEKGVLSVDSEGKKAYFTIPKPKNIRYEYRRRALLSTGLTPSTYHIPCLTSWEGCEKYKKKLRTRMFGLNTKTMK